MNDTHFIENHLLGNTEPADRLFAEAQILISPELRDKLYWQQKTYELVKLEGRRRMKQELENIHRKLFTEKKYDNFRLKILGIFKS